MFCPIELAEYEIKEIDKEIEEIEDLIKSSKRIGWDFLEEPYNKCIAHLKNKQQELAHVAENERKARLSPA